MVTPATQTIGIKKRGPHGRYFDIEDRTGRQIGVNSLFEAICRLEWGWAVLAQAAQTPGLPVVERVRFAGCSTKPCVNDLLSGIGSAGVIDEREATQRRAVLCGRICKLGV
jgi:hypothetical protein